MPMLKQFKKLHLRNSQNEVNMIRIMHQNIQSLNSNNLNLLSYIEHRNFDIDVIILTETWTTNTETYKELLGNYRFIYKKSKNSIAGGIVIYIRENVKWEEINIVEQSDIYDTLTIKLKNRNKQNDIIIKAVYRHMNTNEDEFRKQLSQDIDNLRMKQKNKEIIIIGDMNIDLKKIRYKNQKYLYEIESKGFKQIVEDPTRITQNTATLIDHVFIDNQLNFTYKIENIKVDYGDHNIQILTIEGIEKRVKYNKGFFRKRITKDMEEYYIEYMNNEIGNILEKYQNQDNMDIDEKFDMFLKIIEVGNDIYFPKTEVLIKKTRIKWFNKELRKLRKEKDRKYKQWKLTNTYIDQLIFQKTQSQFKKKLKEAENTYYKKCIETQDSKGKWKTINKLIGKEEKGRDIEIKDKEGNTLSQLEAANLFNSYFVGAGKVTDIEPKIDAQNPQQNNNKTIVNTFMYKEINEINIEHIIHNLKENKATSDDFSIYSIKLIKKPVAKVMSMIVNESMQKSKFPNSLKISTIVPIYKTGDRNEVSNYRPISLTSIFHKIMEKVILEQLWDFVNKYNIINENQYGFRKGHSTTQAIISFVNNIYSKIRMNTVIGLFLDLKKAYDSISHKLIIDKLCTYGIRGSVKDWICDYLADRYQVVKLRNIVSEKRNIERGVLQGSTLGCLLFCLYINDLVGIEEEGKDITIYADDTNVLVWHKEENEAKIKINRELSKINKWLEGNEMALNVEKTKYVIFGNKEEIINRQESKICIKEKEIEGINEINFLGIIIDSKLNFKGHIKKVANKLKMIIPYCYKIRDKLNERDKKMFYYAVIYPVITYGIEVYSNTVWNNIKILDYLHRKVIKILFVMGKRTPTKEIYMKLEILDLRHIIMLQLVKIGHKWANNKLPNKLKNMFYKQDQVSTRQNKNIYKRSLNTYKEQRVIDYRISRYWNVLPNAIKTLNVKHFNDSIKDYYMKQIKDEVKGEFFNKYF